MVQSDHRRKRDCYNLHGRQQIESNSHCRPLLLDPYILLLLPFPNKLVRFVAHQPAIARVRAWRNNAHCVVVAQRHTITA